MRSAFLLTSLVVIVVDTYASSYSLYVCPVVEKYQIQSMALVSDNEADRLFSHARQEINVKFSQQKFKRNRKAELYYCLGELHSMAGKYREAEDLYTRSIRLNIENPMPYISRGPLYQIHGELNRALKDFEIATELDGKLTILHFHKAQINFYLGNYQQALRDLQQEVRNSGENTGDLSLVTLRGDIYSKLGEYEKASDDYTKALNIIKRLSPWKEGDSPRFFPKEFQLYQKLISSYCGLGNISKAHSVHTDAAKRNRQLKGLARGKAVCK